MSFWICNNLSIKKMQNTKLDIGNFFIWFGDQPGRGKITIATGDYGYHYTLLVDQRRRVINIHKTIENDNGQKKYEQLFEMSFYTFLRYAVLFNKADIQLLKKYWLSKRINIGKLCRYNSILFPLTEDESVAKHFIDQKRKKQIRFKKEISIELLLNLYKYPEEIYDSLHSVFWIYSLRRGRCRQQGFIFRHPQDKRRRSFFYVTKRNFAKYKKEVAATLFTILQKLDFKYKEEVLEYMFDQLNEKYPAA